MKTPRSVLMAAAIIEDPNQKQIPRLLKDRDDAVSLDEDVVLNEPMVGMLGLLLRRSRSWRACQEGAGDEELRLQGPGSGSI